MMSFCKEVDAIEEEFSLANTHLAVPHGVAQVEAPAPRKIQQDGLCYLHLKFGKQAYICKALATCPMRSQISLAPSENDRAGR